MDELRPVSQFSYRSHLNRAEVWNRRCWSSSSTAATSKPLKAATRGNAQNFPRLASLFDSISGKFTLKNVILSTQRPIIAGVVHQNSVSPNQKHLKKKPGGRAHSPKTNLFWSHPLAFSGPRDRQRRPGNVTILSLATVIYSVDHLPFGPLEEDMMAPAETKGKIGQLV